MTPVQPSFSIFEAIPRYQAIFFANAALCVARF